MPLIDFKCNTCGEAFQSFQRFNIDMEKGPSCPQCDSEDTETFDAEASQDGVSCEFTPGIGAVK